MHAWTDVIRKTLLCGALAMGLALSIFGGWQLGMLIDFTKDIYKRIPALFT